MNTNEINNKNRTKQKQNKKAIIESAKNLGQSQRIQNQQ